jgi:predicted small lipoprotein YifL
MKRVFLSLSAVALAITLNACEGKDAADLPEHYKHKAGGDHHAEHKDTKAGEHAKPAGEAKPH